MCGSLKIVLLHGNLPANVPGFLFISSPSLPYVTIPSPQNITTWVFHNDILCHFVLCNVYVTRHHVIMQVFNGIRWAENDILGEAIHIVCFGTSHVCPVSIQHLHLSSYKVPTMCHCDVLLATPTSFLMEHTNLEEVELIKVVQLLVDNKLLIILDGEVSICLFVCLCNALSPNDPRLHIFFPINTKRFWLTHLLLIVLVDPHLVDHTYWPHFFSPAIVFHFTTHPQHELHKQKDKVQDHNFW